MTLQEVQGPIKTRINLLLDVMDIDWETRFWLTYRMFIQLEKQKLFQWNYSLPIDPQSILQSKLPFSMQYEPIDEKDEQETQFS